MKWRDERKGAVMEISLFYFRGMMGNIWVDVHGVHLCDTLQEN